jgi:excinuclease UvrABC nuclease subunit
MTSNKIPGIAGWNRWGEDSIKTAPITPGVYVFRLGQAVQRLKGESDIVYIGTSGKGAGSIRTRLKQHLRADVSPGPQLCRITNEVGPLESG